jgi:hypothetical protein
MDKEGRRKKEGRGVSEGNRGDAADDASIPFRNSILLNLTMTRRSKGWRQEDTKENY